MRVGTGLLAVVLVLGACGDGTLDETRLANPAAVFCEEQGGTSGIRTDESGGQVGVCVLGDGTECDEWEFFRGDCGPGPGAELPGDFSVDYAWDSGASNVGPGYHRYAVSLSGSGTGTISFTVGHPSSDRQDRWTETFDADEDDLRSLYATLVVAGVFTRSWDQRDLRPGEAMGSSLRVVAGGREIRVPQNLADSDDRDAAAAVVDEVVGIVPDAIWDDFEARRARYLEEHGE